VKPPNEIKRQGTHIRKQAMLETSGANIASLHCHSFKVDERSYIVNPVQVLCTLTSYDYMRAHTREERPKPKRGRWLLLQHFLNEGGCNVIRGSKICSVRTLETNEIFCFSYDRGPCPQARW